MNRKFKISEFEAFFSGQVLDDGMELSHLKTDWEVTEEKGVLKAVFSEKGLKPVHVLINKTNQFVLSYNCDCFHFTANKGCKHISGLLYLGKNKNVRLIPVNEMRKFGIDDLIEVMGMDELASFLKFYASNNIIFNKLFKQYFSYKFIPYGKNFSDYINQLVQSYMDVNGKFDAKSKKQIHQIFEMHLFRADQMMGVNDWTGAVEIIAALLSRIYYMSFDDGSKSLDYLIERSHRNLVTAAAQSIAPLLKRKINKLSLDLITLPSYNYFEDNNAVLLSSMTMEDNFSSIREAIIERYNTSEGSDKHHWLLHLYLFLTRTNNFELVNFYTDYLDDDKYFTGFLDKANDARIRDAAIDRMIEIRILRMESLTSDKVYKSIASYLINAGKEVLYAQLCDHLFALTMEEEALNIKIMFSVAFQHPKFAKQIAASKYFKKNQQVNADIYGKLLLNSGKIAELIIHFDKYGDVEQIIPVLETLMQYDAIKTMELVKIKLTDYLDSHVGNQSGLLVEDIVQFLSKKRYYEEAEMLVAYLKNNYANRKALIKGLKNV